MTDARYPERWLNDLRLRSLSHDAHSSFVRALAWSVSNKTDGIIKPKHLRLIPDFCEGSEKELVESEAWVEGDGCWHIMEFADTQQTRDQQEGYAQARRANRERQARWKARQREQSGQGKQSVTVTETVTGNVTGDVSETVTTEVRLGQVRTGPNLTRPEEQKVTVATPPSSEAAVVTKSGTSLGGGKAKRGSRLPENWQPPDEVIKAMHAECPTLDLRAAHVKFCDYWHAKAGAGATKCDWAATWRNWMRTANERGECQFIRNGHTAMTRTDARIYDLQQRKLAEQQASGPRKELE